MFFKSLPLNLKKYFFLVSVKPNTQTVSRDREDEGAPCAPHLWIRLITGNNRLRVVSGGLGFTHERGVILLILI